MAAPERPPPAARQINTPFARRLNHAKEHPLTVQTTRELGGMVDAGDLKSPARMGVRVRVPQFAPLITY